MALIQKRNKTNPKIHFLIKIPYILAGLLLVVIGISNITKSSNKNSNDNTDNDIQGVVFTKDGMSTIDNSKFEIVESTSSISKDGTYSIKGKVKQTEEKNFDGLFITFTMYDKDNNKVRSTQSNISNYLGNNIWEFEAYGNDADKIVTSYKLESIYGY